jgi:hypothetical protein
MFPIISKRLCWFFLQLAKQNGIANPFSKEKEAAARFLSRNPKLSVITPESLPFSHAKCSLLRE